MNEQEQRIDAVLDDALAKMRAPDSNPAKVLLDAMYAAYAAGVKTAPPPPGHIIDDAGNVRKVLGTLPVTADGFIVGADAVVYWANCCVYIHEMWVDDRLNVTNGMLAIAGECYSTREAAEAARKER